MSADLRGLFLRGGAVKSVMRPEELGAESLARHLPWLSALGDEVILTRQGDLMASAVLEGQDSFTTEEAELSLVTASFARLIGQLGEGFGFHVSTGNLGARFAFLVIQATASFSPPISSTNPFSTA